MSLTKHTYTNMAALYEKPLNENEIIHKIFFLFFFFIETWLIYERNIYKITQKIDNKRERTLMYKRILVGLGANETPHSLAPPLVEAVSLSKEVDLQPNRQ